jgi:hypothetical protein
LEEQDALAREVWKSTGFFRKERSSLFMTLTSEIWFCHENRWLLVQQVANTTKTVKLALRKLMIIYQQVLKGLKDSSQIGTSKLSQNQHSLNHRLLQTKNWILHPF